jgi:large subunit ribosomal protein L24
MKIKKNDKIKVLTGKDKGKEGVVERVYSKQNAVLVTGVNLYKKHVRKSEQMPQGGIVEIPRPLNVAKVGVICATCKKAVKVGYKTEKGKKIRVCRKCGTSLS